MKPFPFLPVRILTVLTNSNYFLFSIVLNLCLFAELCTSSGAIEYDSEVIELIVETSSVHGCDFIVLFWILHVNGHSSNLVAHPLHFNVQLEFVLARKDIRRDG